MCKTLCKEFPGFYHISAGELLRLALLGNSGIGSTIKEYMNTGKIVPAHITVQLLTIKMMEQGWGKYCFLIDGFPRNKENYDEWVKSMREVDLLSCVYFDATVDNMKSRVLGRNEGRDDDNAGTIIRRINTFLDETKPVIELFREKGKLHIINSNESIEEVSLQFKRVFQGFCLI